MTTSATHRFFQRSGLAAKSDMECDEYRKLFGILENEQSAFLEQESLFRSAEYSWKRDPLYWWSRRWEYPYVYYHLKNQCAAGAGGGQKIVDLGSGVTFFPFALARLGYHVQCLDVDPVCAPDIERAAQAVAHQPGSVEFALISEPRLPLSDGEADGLYCISVLEHIPDFENTIEEMARVVRPEGILILTVDLRLSGSVDIGIDRYYAMRRWLDRYFLLREPEFSIHPLDVLVQYPRLPRLTQWQFQVKQAVKRVIGRSYAASHPNRAVWAGVMTRRDTRGGA